MSMISDSDQYPIKHYKSILMLQVDVKGYRMDVDQLKHQLDVVRNKTEEMYCQFDINELAIVEEESYNTLMSEIANLMRLCKSLIELTDELIVEINNYFDTLKHVEYVTNECRNMKKSIKEKTKDVKSKVSSLKNRFGKLSCLTSDVIRSYIPDMYNVITGSYDDDKLKQIFKESLRGQLLYHE